MWHTKHGSFYAWSLPTLWQLHKDNISVSVGLCEWVIWSYCLYCKYKLMFVYARLHSAGSSASDCRARGHKFESQLGHITFMETDHEIISTAILSLSLIQEGQLSVTAENMGTSTGELLGGLSLSVKGMRLIDRLDITFYSVDWAIKLQLIETIMFVY